MEKPFSNSTHRDWAQIYSIYGSDEWHSIFFLLFHSLLFFTLSFLLLIFYSQLLIFLLPIIPTIYIPALRFLIGFAGTFMIIISVCLLIAAANLLYSSSALRWEISQRMVSCVPDWSSVRTALDIGSGRGFLINSVSMHLKKQRSGGRVVGLVPSRAAAVSALHRASLENVQQYVTCREGDSRSLPFADGFFEVVMSAVHFSKMKTAEERGRGLGEMVRVLKPGGVGVVWDLTCVPEYVQRLREMRMEEIRVSERITAYLVGSHIVSFRKPLSAETTETADWRTNIW